MSTNGGLLAGPGERLLVASQQSLCSTCRMLGRVKEGEASLAEADDSVSDRRHGISLVRLIDCQRGHSEWATGDGVRL
jgi:hypothetical protein